MNASGELRQIVALSLVKNMGPATFKKLMERFGNISLIFGARLKDFQGIEKISKSIYTELKRPDLLEQADKEIGKAAKQNVEIISLLDKRYPEDLREIYDAPILLYVKGLLPEQSTPKMAIVGSRKASLYGLRMAKTIAADLSRAGVVVVSGMALGIDSAAHEGVLSVGGATLAVLGGGLSRLYPSENKKMALEISEKGALISEFPMEMEPRPQYFPLRNRIISGISQAVLVVEAGEKSGALITADAALEQGRDVLAIPGNADSERSSGTNALIKQGAKLVTSAADILEELKMNKGAARVSTAKATVKKKPLDLNPTEEKIFALLQNEPLPMDTLIEESGLPASSAIAQISRLQMKGYVKELPGKNFVRNI